MFSEHKTDNTKTFILTEQHYTLIQNITKFRSEVRHIA